MHIFSFAVDERLIVPYYKVTLVRVQANERGRVPLCKENCSENCFIVPINLMLEKN